MNLLFVCSRNQWRSPTAEALYKNQQGFSARSAGTASSARIKLTPKLILWADLIFVMEQEHKKIIGQKFRSEVVGKEIIVLDIPDEYQFMDPELSEELAIKINTALQQFI